MRANDLSHRPWCDLDEATMGPATDVPTMLNDEEVRLYFWLARHMAPIDGHVVDLGCFAGGSTAYLAEGNRQGGGSARIFAFDQFRASDKVKQRHLYPKGVSAFGGKDILPLSRNLLSPWAPNIAFRKGRIEDAKWTDGPIALLILDASKTSATMDQMADIFFPHLSPGVSVIVQQDELHWKEPWIAVQMQRLKDCFEPLCFVPGGAVAYLCTKQVSPEVLQSRRVNGMNDADMIRALTQAAKRLDAFDVAQKIKRQIEGLRLNPGTRASWSFAVRAPLM